jgi:hypothetical protein
MELFSRSQARAIFPSLEVPSAMAAFLDEWRWDSDVAGCAVIAVRWQRGTYRPTIKPNDSLSGRPYDVDASMSLRTLEEYRFEHCIEKPLGKFVSGARCASPVLCLAKWRLDLIQLSYLG